MPQFPLFYFYFSEVPQLPLSLGQRRHFKGESLQSKSIDKKRSYKNKNKNYKKRYSHEMLFFF